MSDDPADRALRNRFESDGFVALPGFLAGAELNEWLERVARFVREIVPQMPAEQVFFEDRHDPATLKQVQQIGEHDDWFREQLLAGPPHRLAEQLLDGPVVAKNMQYFNKPPGVGQPTPAHQDGHYFMLDPCQAVTMWLALDEVDETNGCVRYARGSHRRGLREHVRTGTLGFSQGIAGYPTAADRETEVALPARPGDLLAHHALTIHRADGNRSSTRSRRALGFIYYSERAREDSVEHEAYQRRLTAELRAAGRL